MTIQALSMQEKRNFTILDNLTVSIKITDNPYRIPLDNVFEMAARNNSKRSYLFVSKLIGKHIQAMPDTPQLTGFLLASRFTEGLGLEVDRNLINNIVNSLSEGVSCSELRPTYNLPGRTVFIGFAETATGLGHAVFDSFTGRINFIHTTREQVEGAFDTVYFTEDHCHAPDQKLLISCPQVLKNNDFVVLIDDEITTGNLCLNIIRSIHKKYPQKQFIILSILDWRSKESKQKYEETAEELGVKISVMALISGTFTSSGLSPVINESPTLFEGAMPPVEMCCSPIGASFETNNARCLKFTGRFGIDEKSNRLLKKEAGEAGSRLSKLRTGDRTLCLGTGEFMYIPFLIAGNMGKGVYVQSTTRSPVHPINKENYAVKHAINFKDPYNANITNFVYNIPRNFYDEVFVFWEREVTPEQVKPLVIAFKELGIKHIVFVCHC